MTKKKQGPTAIRKNYKGAMLTIDEFILLPECEVGRTTAINKLAKGMTFHEIIIEGNKTAGGPKLHPYKGSLISVKDFKRLPGCNLHSARIHTLLRVGNTLAQIISGNYISPKKKPPKKKAKVKRAPKPTFTKAREQPKVRKVKPVDVKRERIKAIMSVAQNPITTQAHYMPKTVMAAGVQGATSLNDKNWMGAV
jgi:hypothetical protein